MLSVWGANPWFMVKSKPSARTSEDELTGLHPKLGSYIRERFGLWSGKNLLMQSCSLESGEEISEDEASAIIIREL